MTLPSHSHLGARARPANGIAGTRPGLSSQRRNASLAMFLLATATAPVPARADVISWTGGVSSDWFTTGNWSSGTLPTATDTAAIETGAGVAPVLETGTTTTQAVSVGASTAGATLTLQAGGGLTTTTLNVGIGGTASGAVTVTGTGTNLTVLQDMNISAYGTGSLSVLDGATASVAGTSYIGGYDGGTGTVTVSGTGSKWTSQTANFGNYGSGELVVSAGGTAESTTANLGTFNTGVGTATITGAGSTWTVTGDIVVGYSGTGTLKVEDGGVVTGGTVQVGYLTGAQGSATVTGTGSSLTTDSLVVGVFGNGSLDIANGGTVKATEATIGGLVGGTATATVSGTGSQLTAGTLLVGNYGTGSLAVSDGGTVKADSATLGKQVGGSGSLTLRGSSSSLTTTGSLVVGEYGTGTLTIAEGASVSVGSGTLVVAANPGATGTVNIGAASGDAATTAGTLTASAVAFGSGTGKLNFNHTEADYVFTAAVSGAGSISVESGTTTLAAANTYTGGTTISAGTLVGTASSFGTGAITANGTLVLRQDTDASFTNTLSGTGVFAKEGSGTLTVDTTNSFTGATQVRAGTLAVNGALAGSTVTVESGATLTGAGTIGGLDARAGSLVSPGGTGGAVATLSVAGDSVQRSGSVYAVQIGTSGSDRIAVSGSATVESGAVLAVSNTTGSPYAVDAQYAVLTTGTGVTGNYTLTGDTRVSTFYTLLATSDGQNIYLDSTQTRAFTDAAATANQKATAGALQGMAEGSRLRDAVGAQQTDAAARSAFNLLSGEIYASSKALLLQDSRFVRDASLERARAGLSGEDSPSAASRCVGRTNELGLRGNDLGDCAKVWVQGFGSWGQFDGNGNAAALSRTVGGILAGADAQVLPGVRAGVVGGYSRSTFSVDARSSWGTSDNYSVGAYGGTQWGGLGLRAGTTYTWSDIGIDRAIAFPGFAENLSSGYGAGTAQAFGELGYRFAAAPGPRPAWSLEPFAGLAYVNVASDSFAETGGVAGLIAAADTTSVTYSTLGLRASSALALAGFDLRAGATVGWRHAFGDVSTSSTLAFLGSGPFTVAGVPLAGDVAVIEADLSAALSRSTLLTVSYSGQFGDAMQDQGVRGNVVSRF